MTNVVVPRAPVVHGDESLRQGGADAVLEVFQVPDRGRRHVDPRPADRGTRELVERERLAAEDGAVVVPPDRPHLPSAQDFQDLVRPRVIADEVARDPDAIRGDAVDVREDRLQRRTVRMDVGQDREAHRASERAGAISGVQRNASVTLK